MPLPPPGSRVSCVFSGSGFPNLGDIGLDQIRVWGGDHVPAPLASTLPCREPPPSLLFPRPHIFTTKKSPDIDECFSRLAKSPPT